MRTPHPHSPARARRARHRPLALAATGPSLLALLVSGCSPDATVPRASGPVSLTIVSGSGQTGRAGAELAQRLVVKATTSTGTALPNLTVFFVVTQGGGRMYAGGGDIVHGGALPG